MKLAWSRHAAADRLAIFTWIAQDDPRSAALVDDRLEDAVRRLSIGMELGTGIGVQ